MVDLTKPVAIMCFSGGAGGMEMSAVNLAKLLSTVTSVVLVCKQGSFLERLNIAENSGGYTCETIDFSSRTFSPAMLIKARQIIKIYNIKNIIYLGASELKTLYFAFIGLSLNLLVLHGTTKSKPKSDFIHRLVYSNVNYHVAISEYLSRNVKTIVPFGKKTKSRVIRLSRVCRGDGLDKELDSSDVISIVHVGRIASGKGQVDAVQACGLLNRLGIKFKLTLLGSSEGSNYISDVKAAISDNSISESVEMVGHVNNVDSYLERADIMLFPSRGEGLSLAFVEALHHNIVCIAYENTVFPEYVNLGFYVHLVNDGRVDELSNKLLDIAMNLSEEKARSLCNIELAGKLFSPERELGEWLEILV